MHTACLVQFLVDCLNIFILTEYNWVMPQSALPPCTPGCTPAQGTTVRIDHELCMTTTGIGPLCNGNVRFAPSGVQFGS